MPVEVIQGETPVVFVLPYAGSDIPRTVYPRLTETGRSLAETDAYIDRLVPSRAQTLTVMRVTFNRYVSDAETDFGRNERMRRHRADHIGVVPLLDRMGQPLCDVPPTPTEAARWRTAFHTPFQAALVAQMARTRAQHRHAVLLVLHTLRDAAGPEAADIVLCAEADDAMRNDWAAKVNALLDTTSSFNCRRLSLSAARWLARSTHRPELGIHALQVAIRPDCYLTTEGEVVHFDADKAQAVRRLLARLVDIFIP